MSGLETQNTGDEFEQLQTEWLKNLSKLKKDITNGGGGKSLEQKPVSTYVDPKIVPSPKLSKTTVVSGEFYGEKRGDAPGEKYVYKVGNELNYLNMHKKLDDEDYKTLFHGLVDVKQGFFGDCYLVSTIKSLARSRYFDTLMMTSIEKNDDGSFNLYLPLGDTKGRKIHISKEELNLAQIKGSTGYKILEVGFAKEAIFRKNGSMLVVGDMPDIKLTKESMNGIVGGSSNHALATLLGPSNISRLLVENKPEKKNQILNILKNFDPKNLNLILFSSRRRPKGVPSTEKTYTVAGQKMYYHHAYSLYSVEKRGYKIESVTIEDPANNKGKIKLPLLTFMSAFSRLTSCSPKKRFLSPF